MADMNYAGICAIIAVVAVSITVIITIIGIVWTGRALTEQGATALNVAIGGLLALAGAYIGGKGHL